jgi:hypothetical protein
MKPFKFILLIILTVLCSCESRNEAIKTYWKYMEGHHFGDVLIFDDEITQIKGDTILMNSVPFAIIDNFENSIFHGTENKLTLKDIESGKLGLYTDKGK